MSSSILRRAGALLGAAFVGGAVAIAAPAVLPALAVPTTSQSDPAVVVPSVASEASRPDLGLEERKTIGIFRRASPSVANITRLGRGGVAGGTGSGFVWDREGHVVTNYHVVRGAAGARVTLDHKTYDAEIVGAAVEKDLAVLRVRAPESALQPLVVGASDNLLVGQHVFAIGNPFGLDQTLSTGVISGLGREIKSVAGHPITGVVQTDAAINPGNSGGPLLDSQGRLIGVNTAIFSPSGASAGVGFAVPADTVARIVPQLIEHGKVVRPGLGVEIARGSVRGTGGVLIMGVMPGSGAEAAGLRGSRRDPQTGAARLGDVIVALDGQRIVKTEDLFRVLDTRKVGDRVKVEVLRDGERKTFDVSLQALSS